MEEIKPKGGGITQTKGGTKLLKLILTKTPILLLSTTIRSTTIPTTIPTTPTISTSREVPTPT
ncbi:hypothetical protein AHAS_Ahas17G0184100 [Arachis hypogaea]